MIENLEEGIFAQREITTDGPALRIEVAKFAGCSELVAIKFRHLIEPTRLQAKVGELFDHALTTATSTRRATPTGAAQSFYDGTTAEFITMPRATFAASRPRASGSPCPWQLSSPNL